MYCFLFHLDDGTICPWWRHWLHLYQTASTALSPAHFGYAPLDRTNGELEGSAGSRQYRRKERKWKWKWKWEGWDNGPVYSVLVVLAVLAMTMTTGWIINMGAEREIK